MIIIQNHNYECLELLCEEYWKQIDSINTEETIDVNYGLSELKTTKFNTFQQSVIYNVDDSRFTTILVKTLFKKLMRQNKSH